ncbi:hypothetical protein [Natronococcus wangiae]|uniref:hypothetical protein n=1 Tax=Natronococcus wangiae TaxID=3068275 RepID=UPI00273D66BF|nr:hypothetical protein [Natronococcus sp. AD5]
MSAVIMGGIVLFMLVALHFYPEKVETWWVRIYTTKEAMFGFAGLVIAFFLIQTGNVWLVILGMATMAYGVLWVRFEKPHRNVVHFVKG